jgi:hypothetical protein
LSQKSIKVQFNNAETVVFGKIQKIETIGSNDEFKSEHHPYWKKAEVLVTETLKGKKETIVYFYFPSSNDIMWENSPKFKVGDSGIWFLSTAKLMETELSGYSVSHQKFYFADGELNNIKNSIK